MVLLTWLHSRQKPSDSCQQISESFWVVWYLLARLRWHLHWVESDICWFALSVTSICLIMARAHLIGSPYWTPLNAKAIWVWPTNIRILLSGLIFVGEAQMAFGLSGVWYLLVCPAGHFHPSLMISGAHPNGAPYLTPLNAKAIRSRQQISDSFGWYDICWRGSDGICVEWSLIFVGLPLPVTSIPV